MKLNPLLPAALLCVACSSAPISVMTTQGLEQITWTHDERKQDIAVQHLRRTETASHHLVRLAGSEVPHVHRKSDLTVTVLRADPKNKLTGNSSSDLDT